MIIQTGKVLRKRADFDLYPTPVEAVRQYLEIIPLDEIKYNPFYRLQVLDVGAGNGIWGGVLFDRVGKENILLDGVEYQSKDKFEDKSWFPKYDNWYQDDYLNWDADTEYDVIIGNPPYGKDVKGKKDRKYAEKFIRKAYDELSDGGFICFLLRLNFLEGKDRGNNFWNIYKPRRVEVSTKRPSFTGNKKTDATAYAVYLWQKGYTGDTILDWVIWEYDK